MSDKISKTPEEWKAELTQRNFKCAAPKAQSALFPGNIGTTTQKVNIAVLVVARRYSVLKLNSIPAPDGLAFGRRWPTNKLQLKPTIVYG